MTPVKTPQATQITVATQISTKFDPKENKAEAEKQLNKLKADALENCTEDLEKIRADSQQAFINFVEEGDHPLREDFDAGLDNYVSATCLHVLIDALMLGHKEPGDFPRSMNSELYKTQDEINEYYEDLSATYDRSSSDSASLQEMVKNELPNQVTAIKAFFDSEKVRLKDGVTLVHGVVC